MVVVNYYDNNYCVNDCATNHPCAVILIFAEEVVLLPTIIIRV